MIQSNATTGLHFRALNLPCRFLDKKSGKCTIYESRPLVCRVFPFYPEPLTGHATLLPAQCGANLHVLPMDSDEGWCLADHEKATHQWLRDLWSEAGAITHTASSHQSPEPQDLRKESPSTKSDHPSPQSCGNEP